MLRNISSAMQIHFHLSLAAAPYQKMVMQWTVLLIFGLWKHLRQATVDLQHHPSRMKWKELLPVIWLEGHTYNTKISCAYQISHLFAKPSMRWRETKDNRSVQLHIWLMQRTLGISPSAFLVPHPSHTLLTSPFHSATLLRRSHQTANNILFPRSNLLVVCANADWWIMQTATLCCEKTTNQWRVFCNLQEERQ